MPTISRSITAQSTKQGWQISLLGGLCTCAVLSTACTDDSSVDTPSGGGKADDAWCHARLRAGDGVELQIDYQVKDTSDADSFDMSMTPVWLNVRGAAFHSDQQAQAVVIRRIWDNECGAVCRDHSSIEAQVEIVDLKWEHGRFTAELPMQNIQHHDNNSNGGGTSSLLELAVVVDETWYKADDGNNVRFLPTTFSGFCAR